MTPTPNRSRPHQATLLFGLVLASCLSSVAHALTSEVPATTSGKKAAILPVTGEITDLTVESLKRRVALAREQGAEVVILDMDTPGGLVTSSIAAADLIKNLADIRTIAWVNPNAHSGGAIIAVACNEIVMARSSRIGDSQVIMGGPQGVSAVPEDLKPKAYTPVLAEFRASCRLNGYDQTLCEAFVVPEREVWWVENTETGERRFVLREEKQRLLGQPTTKTNPNPDREGGAAPDQNPDRQGGAKATDDATPDPDSPDVRRDKEGASAGVDGTSASTPMAPEAGTSTTAWKLVEKYYDPLLDMEVDTIQPVVRDDQLLEMSAGEAHAYGFSKGVVVGEDALRARYDLASTVRLESTWSEVLAFWLTSEYVRGFLMVIILLGAYVEFHTPGVGVPGLVALICLGIFVGAPYLTGLANVWEILCVGVGFALIALEVFVIPGFGVAGISGILLVFVGLLATFVPEEPGRSFPLYLPSLPSTLHYTKVALVTLSASMITSLIGMIMLSRYLPRLPVFRRIAPANPTPSEVQMDDPYRGLARVGDVGETSGPLHPAGKAFFGGRLVDVVTQGEYLEDHTQIEVVERRGNRVVVRAQS